MIGHLHVGMPKTGTTAVQEYVATADLGHIRNVALGPPNKSGLFTILFEEKPWNVRPQKVNGRSRGELLRLRSERLAHLAEWLNMAAADPGCDGVFFSGERMSMPLAHGESALERLRAEFGKICSGFRIYGYVRPLASHLPSHFQQRMKTGAPGRLSFDVLYPEYRASFEKFDRVFGRHAVSLRPYRREAMVEGDVVADLLSQLGAPAGRAATLRENTSLSVRGTALLFAIRRAGHLSRTTREEVEIGNRVLDLLSGVGGGGFCFDPAAVSALADRNRADIDWIEARLGGDISSAPEPETTVIRTDRDLMEIAASARRELLALDPRASGVDPRTIAAWIEEGLVAA